MRRVFILAAFLGLVTLHADYVYSQSCTDQFDSGTGCPNCVISGAVLQGFTTQDSESHPDAMTKGYGLGVKSDGTNLTLEEHGGEFTATATATNHPSAIRVAAAGDFDGDGWTDLVVADRGNLPTYPQYLALLKNNTALQPAPADWSDPTQIRTPQFDMPFVPHPVTSSPYGFGIRFNSCSVAVASADFDKDGDLDVARIRCDGATTVSAVEIFLNPGDGNFADAAQWLFHDGTGLGDIKASANSLVADDWNNDGFPDLIFSNATSSAGDRGQVHVLIHPTCSPCTGPYPTATAQRILGGPAGLEVVEPILTNGEGLTSIAYADFDGDGNKDIIGGGPNETSLRMWLSNGSGSYQPGVVLSHGLTSASAQALIPHDFDLDGQVDLFFSIDRNTGLVPFGDRGDGYIWYNAGGATPFGAANPPTLEFDQAADSDLDGGTLLDYDQDPSGTLDLFVGDGVTGAGADKYFTLANRTAAEFTDCGEVISEPIDTSSISPADFVVEGVRLSNVVLADATDLDRQDPCDGSTGDCIQFWATNVDPPDPSKWVKATACATGPATDRCANLNPNEGRTVRWKAVLCSDDTTVPANLTTPNLNSLETSVDYQPGTLSFRSGVVVHKGSVYAGGLRQPGDRGRFFAFPADDFANETWEASEVIDSQGAAGRTVWSVDLTGTTIVDFEDATTMKPLFGVATDPEAQNLIDWFFSERFELDPAAGPSDRTSLGAINNSTPAVVGAPGLPLFYAFLPATGAGATKQTADTFINSNSDRYELAFFGSKDGALHAFTAVASPEGGAGLEKWAFVSREVASNMPADEAAWPSDGHYPDASPTVADFHDAAGVFKTALLVGAGDGGTSFFALDITKTVDTATYAPIAPDPLWKFDGMAAPGPAKSKPVVVRTLTPAPALNTMFLAIMATGEGGPGTGREVVALDLETGTEQWRFEAKCAVTSDIVGFETDDETVTVTASGEKIDGYIDRIVFADACGYVYKVDPTLRPASTYITSETGPAVASTPWDLQDVTTDPDGNTNDALFYVGNDTTVEGTLNPIAGVISTDRPIYGTIAARPDSSTRLVLFFGTGGAESVATTEVNNFFAIYADTGEVRSKLFDAGTPTDNTGTGCDTVCKKFYGGAVVTETQVAVALTTDPVTSASCDFGSSEVKVFSLDDTSNTGEQVSETLSAGSVSGLFAGQGAIYLTLLDGSVVQMGNPSQANPSAPDPGQGVGAGDSYIKGDIIAVSGWRQVLY